MCTIDETLSGKYVELKLEYMFYLVKEQVNKYRRIYGEKEYFGSCYISGADIDELLDKPFTYPLWASSLPIIDTNVHEGDGPYLKKTRQIGKALVSIRNEAQKNGVCLDLDEIKRKYELSDFDENLILLCILTETDLRFENVIGYLNNDISKRGLTTGLSLLLLSSSYDDFIANRNYLYQSSPLLKYGIAFVNDEPQAGASGWLSKTIHINNGFISHLTSVGSKNIRNSETDNAFVDCAYIDLNENVEQIYRLLRDKIVKDKRNCSFVNLVGGEGEGKKNLIRYLCHSNRIGLVLVNSENVKEESNLKEIVLGATLSDSVLYWSNSDTLFEDENHIKLVEILELSRKVGLVNVFATTSIWPWTTEVSPDPPFVVALPRTTKEERYKHLKRALKFEDISEQEIVELSEVYRLGRGQIEEVVAVSKQIVRERNDKQGKLDTAALVLGCQRQSNRSLGKLARMIVPIYDWDDIVLPDDTRKHLKEIVNTAINQRNVYEVWGFEQNMSLGKGLSVVFAGDSGMGKTMAAEIIAKNLNTIIYKIDLAAVVSKYIGETEKNLAKIFNAAEKSNCILLFDEADAIFGKRSAVKDARDRYANIETSYLLQKIEEYEGIVILTTNILGNIDSAFMRRIKFVVNFRKPTKELRQKIWTCIWPESTPLSDDIDFEYIAESFEFSGGNIKNAAVAAAFLAAETNEKVRISHIAEAIKREAQKSDHIYSEDRYDIPTKS